MVGVEYDGAWKEGVRHGRVRHDHIAAGNIPLACL